MAHGHIAPAEKPGRRLHFAAICIVALLSCALYLPYLQNPLVFDDYVFFYSNQFAYFATHPIGLRPRTPAYFSLAAIEVLSGHVEVHRLVSLALHVACSLALYGLARDLLRLAWQKGGAGEQQAVESHGTVFAAFAAGAFAIHPAAVYAAAYLAQRSIVVATLCALLSLRLLLRGVVTNRYGITLAGAGLFSIAVFAKEHSILIPAAAMPLVMVASAHWRQRVKHAALYLGASMPAAILVVMLMKHIVGAPYEPHAAAIVAQGASPVEPVTHAGGWLASAIAQLGLFFRYIGLWIWPEAARMAVDLRMDPLESWTLPWAVVNVGGFATAGGLGVAMLRRGGSAAVMGAGILYACILFLVELSVLRFQEPFVVYRSYLWAPGIALAAAGLLSFAGIRIAVVALALSLPILFAQARDRLDTFTSPLRLWEDAAAKLPSHPVPLGWRILYNLGKAYLYAGQPEKALAVASRCLAEYPTTYQCIFARGAIRFERREFVPALHDFLRAADVEPGSGVTQHRIGLTLERLGRAEEARQRYRKAAALGYPGGAIELSRLGEPVHTTTGASRGARATR